MIIPERDILNEWIVDSVSDFAKQFTLEKEICNEFLIDDIEDIYDCKQFEGVADSEVIEKYLEKDSRAFEIMEIPDKNIGCRWNIREVKQDA